MAQEKQTVVYPIYPAVGGIEQSAVTGSAPPGKMVAADNVIFSINGSRKKRWGLSQYYVSGFPPKAPLDGTFNFRAIKDFWRNTGTAQQHMTVMVGNGKVYADASDGRFTDITAAASFVRDEQITMDVFSGLLIICFESDEPYYWIQTGSLATLDSLRVSFGKTNPIPSCSICRIHDRRLWLAGNPAAPHRLYYSAADQPWNFDLADGAGTIDLDAGDSDPVGITAIFPTFMGQLYVAKRRSLYRVTTQYSADLSTVMYGLEGVVQGVGCIAHNGVAATPNDIIWPSERGIHSLVKTDKFGDIDVSFLSSPFHKYYQTQMNFLRSKNMYAVYVPELNSYMLAYTRRGQLYNKDVLLYNLVLQEWTMWQNYDCAAMCQYIDQFNKTRLLVCRESARNIGITEEYMTTDFGTSYPMYFTTPVIFPLGSPNLVMDFKYLWLYFKVQPRGDIIVTYKIDNQADQSVTVSQLAVGTSLIGYSTIGKAVIGAGSGDTKMLAVPLLGSGHSIQITFSQTPSDPEIGEDCDIYGYMIEGEYAGDSVIATASTD